MKIKRYTVCCESQKRLASSINFKGSKHVSDVLGIFEMPKNKTNMDITIYDGKSVFNLSKILKYEFFYDYIIIKWSEGLAPVIKANNFHENIKDDVVDRYDTSN